MSERHCCKYCNVWMQGDKSSIRHHEQGRKHKEMLEATLKQKRKEKSDAFHAEKDLKQQLREIEKAAHAKYKQDLAAAGLPPPPPPPRSGKFKTRDGGDKKHFDRERRPRTNQEEGGEGEGDEEPPKEDDKGVYEIRGTVYLEGKRHESQLVAGSACQIWVDDLDEWMDALIEESVVHRVPNTELSFHRLTVMYMPPDGNSPMTEKGALADRIRIRLPDEMTLEEAHRMVDAWANGEVWTPQEPVQIVEVDEATGMGEWSTVEVREVDESDAAVAQQHAEVEAASKTEAKDEEDQRRRQEALDDFSAQGGDNALGAFNPWGGSYKGIDIENESARGRKAREEEIMIQADGDVSFKKRSKPTNATGGSVDQTTNSKKKKQRRIRSEDDD